MAANDLVAPPTFLSNHQETGWTMLGVIFTDQSPFCQQTSALRGRTIKAQFYTPLCRVAWMLCSPLITGVVGDLYL